MDIRDRTMDAVEGQYLTPIPREVGESITMSFPDAMKKVIEGKKVRRLEWPDEDYSFLKDEWLSIFTKGKFHTWLVSAGDMLDVEDYIVVKEIN